LGSQSENPEITFDMPNKSDASLQSIALAAIRRHGVCLEEWAFTKLGNEAGLQGAGLEGGELPVVSAVKDEGNWTLITTRRAYGAFAGVAVEQEVDQIDDLIFALPRSMEQRFGQFRTIDFTGRAQDFFMEAGPAKQAFVEALRYLRRSRG